MTLPPALADAARQASRHAYCQYSHFAVGAVLEGADGQLFAGCNVENASFGLTICAERVALFRAVADGVQNFRRLVIYTPTAEPTPPCGACRQVLDEFAPQLEVFAICDGPATLHCSLGELLPEPFRL